jgi:hypothetical protein
MTEDQQEAFATLTAATARLAFAAAEWEKAKSAYLATSPYGNGAGKP